MIADAGVVGEASGLDWARLDALKAANPEKKLFSTDLMREQLLLPLAYTSFTDYVDWETGICRYESPGFIRMLEEAKKLPDVDDAMKLLTSDEWVEASKIDEITEGKILFDVEELRSVQDYQRILTRLGENANFIGFPTESGTGTLLKLPSSFAITKACKDKAGAWQFLREQLLAEQKTGNVVFSTNRTLFEAELATAMTPAGTMDQWGQPLSVFEKPFVQLTEADAEYLRGMIRTAKPAALYDAEIDAIIQNEASYYCSGACTAGEAAAAVQKRVSLYVGEQQ